MSALAAARDGQSELVTQRAALSDPARSESCRLDLRDVVAAHALTQLDLLLALRDCRFRNDGFAGPFHDIESALAHPTTRPNAPAQVTAFTIALRGSRASAPDWVTSCARPRRLQGGARWPVDSGLPAGCSRARASTTWSRCRAARHPLQEVHAPALRRSDAPM
jgi:hypothetical protein